MVYWLNVIVFQQVVIWLYGRREPGLSGFPFLVGKLVFFGQFCELFCSFCGVVLTVDVEIDEVSSVSG